MKLRHLSYWMRDFSIFDNNGYELVFGEDISKKIRNLQINAIEKNNTL
jgi:hypothetical protein